MANEATLEAPVSELNEVEKKFLERARKMFEENTDWFEFEGFAFGMWSPVFSKTRSHRRSVVESPLYLALRDMWLKLGLRQGWIAENDDAVEVIDDDEGRSS